MAGILLGWAGLIGLRLAQLQVLEEERYREKAERQQTRIVEVPAPRGQILDRTGLELALNVKSEALTVNPRRLADSPGAVGMAAAAIAPVLDADSGALAAKLKRAQARNRGYLALQKDLSREQIDRLRDLRDRYEYVELEESSRRYYPKGDLAAQVVGVTGFIAKSEDTTVETGTVGIERSLDQELRGVDGERWELRDVRRKVLASSQRDPVNGADIQLTIDARVQYVAQKALAEAVAAAEAETGTAVVLVPQTGEVLAIASYPFFDPNEKPRNSSDLSARLNRAISAPFEPGSVFKVFTFAAALENTNFQPETIVNCGGGSIYLFGLTIRDHHRYGSLSFADVLAKSSNVGTINVALQVGPERLYEYLKRFGFGEPTGIELPAEDPGVLHPLSRWKRHSVGYVAIGHEVMATTLQLARGVGAIANNGLMVEPRIIASPARPRPAARRVIRPETSVRLRALMERVVLMGTGRGAALEGYSAAGKTGSAQIYDPQTRTYTHRYNASFVGFAPVSNPEVVVAVTVHGSDKFGGTVSAPAFKLIASEALMHLKARPDLPAPPERLVASNQKTEEPDLSDVTGIEPDAGTVEPEEDDPGRPYPIGPRAPDFLGMSKPSVLALAVASGLSVEAVGRGVARAQIPAPGAVLPPNGRVEVRFSY